MNIVFAACTVWLCSQAILLGSASAESLHTLGKGPLVRAGSSVGMSEIADYQWMTLGGHVALGYHFGPFTLELEYDRSDLRFATEPTSEYQGGVRRGEVHRLGTNLRYYFANVLHQKNADILLFVDLGAGRQRGILEGASFSRRDYGGGFGFLFDYQTRWNGLSSIGWQLGWRFVNSKRAPEAMARIICAKNCEVRAPPGVSDLSTTLSSSLSLRW